MQLPKEINRLLADRSVTDVILNSATETFAMRRLELARIPNIFRSEPELIDFAKNAIDSGGNHLDFSNPICDAVLTSNEVAELEQLQISSLRVHAALALGIGNRNLISIRIHRLQTPSLDAFGSVDALQEIAKSHSFAISGSAGSGKTTLLRAMLALEPTLRSILIEDSPELMPISGHFIGLNSRSPNTEGRGEVALPRLLRESLRMMPQRLVIGEVRGAEVATLLQALNLGVNQVAFSIHANQANQVKARLLSLWLQSGLSSSDLDSLLQNQPLKIIHLKNHEVHGISELS